MFTSLLHQTPLDSVTQLPAKSRLSVLLVDDQAISAEAVRRWLSTESDIDFHYCGDPTKAVAMANEIRPTVILQDLVMPDIDGLQLVKFFRANTATRDTPMVVLSGREEPLIKAEAFALGANDYLVKWPDKVELIARLRYHSRGYVHLLERNQAYAELASSKRELQHEIEAGANYVMSLLPSPMNDRLNIDWRYVPCVALAGDSLGYHWLDEDRLAIYILDVTGHGIASALLSVTVMNVLRARSLPNVDFANPGQVLSGLNRAFGMEEHGNKCFTMWYGVYNAKTRRLAWAGGGHPAAFLFGPEHSQKNGAKPNPQLLSSEGPVVGIMPWDDWGMQEVDIAPGSRLLLYTDGAHEIQRTDGTIWPFKEFTDFVSEAVQTTETRSVMDQLFEHVTRLKGAMTLADDFTAVEVSFNGVHAAS